MTAQRYSHVAHRSFWRSDTDTCNSDTDTFLQRYANVHNRDTDTFTERYRQVAQRGNLKVIPRDKKKRSLRAPLPIQSKPGVSNVQ